MRDRNAVNLTQVVVTGGNRTRTVSVVGSDLDRARLVGSTLPP